MLIYPKGLTSCLNLYCYTMLYYTKAGHICSTSWGNEALNRTTSGLIRSRVHWIPKKITVSIHRRTQRCKVESVTQRPNDVTKRFTTWNVFTVKDRSSNKNKIKIYNFDWTNSWLNDSHFVTAVALTKPNKESGAVYFFGSLWLIPTWYPCDTDVDTGVIPRRSSCKIRRWKPVWPPCVMLYISQTLSRIAGSCAFQL
jgi:hypothetical protein